MIEALRRVLDEMKEHLIKAGISERSINAVLNEKLEHAMILDSVLGVKKMEYQKVVQTWLLQPPDVWAFYAAREVEDLREVKMLRSARRDLRNAWHKRVAVFARKGIKDGQEGQQTDAGGGQEGSVGLGGEPAAGPGSDLG